MRNAFTLCILAMSLSVPAIAADVEEESTLPSTEARVPNFIAATGLLYAPSAYTVGDRGASAYAAGNASFFGGGAVIGITDRFELGLGVLDLDSDLGGDTQFLLNAKFNILAEKNQWPGLSVGVIDALDEFDGGVSWYVVASKYFTRADTDQRFALKGHLGYGGGTFFDEDLFAGAELFFRPNFSAMAEFVNDNFNVGGRLHWKAFTATVALFDFSDLGGQITYNVRF
jgi:hypothetical protein